MKQIYQVKRRVALATASLLLLFTNSANAHDLGTFEMGKHLVKSGHIHLIALKHPFKVISKGHGPVTSPTSPPASPPSAPISSPVGAQPSGPPSAAYINPRNSQYNGGAKGDGITDDTLAITQAFADAAAKGEPVYFSTGNYLTTTCITVPANVAISGAGSSAVIQANDSTNAALILSSGDSVKNMAFMEATPMVSGSYLVTSRNASISIQNAASCSVTNCSFNNAFFGIEADGANGLMIAANSFGGNMYGPIQIGFTPPSSQPNQNITIQQNLFAGSENGTFVEVPDAPVTLSSGSNVQVLSNTFTNYIWNGAITVQTLGGLASEVSGVTIAGNSMNNCGSLGRGCVTLVVDNATLTSGSQVSNNTFTNCETNAIFEYNGDGPPQSTSSSGSLTISGNVISTVRTPGDDGFGIVVVRCGSTQILNNQISTTQGPGILLVSNFGTEVISGNTLTNCGVSSPATDWGYTINSVIYVGQASSNPPLNSLVIQNNNYTGPANQNLGYFIDASVPMAVVSATGNTQSSTTLPSVLGQ
jgi:parallel beta-helix repeat protein